MLSTFSQMLILRALQHFLVDLWYFWGTCVYECLSYSVFLLPSHVNTNVGDKEPPKKEENSAQTSPAIVPAVFMKKFMIRR